MLKVNLRYPPQLRIGEKKISQHHDVFWILRQGKHNLSLTSPEKEPSQRAQCYFNKLQGKLSCIDLLDEYEACLQN